MELPLALERDKMSFLPVVPEGQHGVRGKMHDVIEEMPLVVLEREVGNFREGKSLISFQKWVSKELPR